MPYTYTSQHDFGAFLLDEMAYRPTTLTTASGTLTGSAVDRAPLNSPNGPYGWVRVSVPFNVTAKSHAKITSTVKVQHSSVSSAGFTDYPFKDGSTVGTFHTGTTASTATQTNTSSLNTFDVDLHAAKRYIKVVLVPGLTVGSSTVTTTGQLSATFTFGGGVNYPLT